MCEKRKASCFIILEHFFTIRVGLHVKWIHLRLIRGYLVTSAGRILWPHHGNLIKHHRCIISNTLLLTVMT